jgi:hypothetical protein
MSYLAEILRTVGLSRIFYLAHLYRATFPLGNFDLFEYLSFLFLYQSLVGQPVPSI